MHYAESELSNCGRLQISVLACNKSPKEISNKCTKLLLISLKPTTLALTELYIIEYLGEVETEFNMF